MTAPSLATFKMKFRLLFNVNSVSYFFSFRQSTVPQWKPVYLFLVALLK